jgi:hypothetical protein
LNVHRIGKQAVKTLEATQSPCCVPIAHRPSGDCSSQSPKKLDILGRGWSKWAGWLSSLGLVVAIGFQCRSENFTVFATLVPHSGVFWLILLASYLVGPLADWLIFRKLWGLSVSGIAPLLRKSVLNALFFSYAGEAYFFSWSRAQLAAHQPPFGSIKDVAILSAIIGNAATLVLVLIAWPMLSDMHLGIGNLPLVGSVATLGIISVSAIIFRKKVFHLASGQIAYVSGIHLARIVLAAGLAALLWHIALPNIALRWWLLLSAGRMMVSRLPLIPNKDLAFAGVAALIFHENLQIVGLLAMTAMLVFVANVVFGLSFVVGDLRKRPAQRVSFSF